MRAGSIVLAGIILLQLVPPGAAAPTYPPSVHAFTGIGAGWATIEITLAAPGRIGVDSYAAVDGYEALVRYDLYDSNGQGVWSAGSSTRSSMSGIKLEADAGPVQQDGSSGGSRPAERREWDSLPITSGLLSAGTYLLRHWTAGDVDGWFADVLAEPVESLRIVGQGTRGTYVFRTEDFHPGLMVAQSSILVARGMHLELTLNEGFVGTFAAGSTMGGSSIESPEGVANCGGGCSFSTPFGPGPAGPNVYAFRFDAAGQGMAHIFGIDVPLDASE